MTEDDLYVALIDVVDNAVGADLTTLPSGQNAIFKNSVANQIGKALYGLRPYVRIVMGNVSPQGANRHSSWYDSTTGDKVTQTILDVDFTLQVVGGHATDLCRKIQQHLMLSEYAKVNLSNAGIVAPRAEPVRPTTTYFNDQATDSAFFLGTLTTTDTLVESEYGINIVNADLHVRHHPSDEDIVSTTINLDTQ